MLGAKQLFCKYATPLGALGTCTKSWFCVHGIVRRALRESRLGFLPKTKKCPTGHPSNVAEAKCENVWMEVCTKVAAAALVSVPWRVSVRVGLK